jgi:hypothetical protein
MDDKIKNDKIKNDNEVLTKAKEPVKDSLQDEATNKIKKVEEKAAKDNSLNENINEESNCDDSTPLDNKDVLVAEVVGQDDKTQYDAKSYGEGKNRMKDNPNAHPYNHNTEVKRTTSDDAGSIAMILGIIAIVCSITGLLAIVGLVLGILALVKGAKVRKYSSSGMAGWVLGIIAIIFSGVKILIGLAFVSHIFLFAPFFM